ncbi:MAG: peroxiredoxin [Phenylobacterium sp.]|uniref:peroxiredoxin n=1 Tax=Phenylobacterium sp. TaxID=1871053 RepID=UPI0025F8BDA9|nr:peroxiredoxin [Phenylobacterium sp.]MCG9917012.1 peroxiredoxin [Phenylobacterium sp.]
MTIKIGDKLPTVTLTQATLDGPKPVTTDDLFNGKKVALFAVPGAFTPTCSARHLPGYVDKAEAMKAQGVELIACLSVNDAFVMKAWGESQAVGEDIMMLADGSGDFTRAVGLTMDATKFGMGERSQRYSMIVEDGVVKSLNVEEAGEFRVSSAEYLMDQLGG